MKTHIVISDKGHPMQLHEWTPGIPVLALGDRAQTFSYSQARRAIARTRAYARKEGLPWKAHAFRPLRLS